MSASPLLRVRAVDIARDPVKGARVRLLRKGGDSFDRERDKRRGLHWTDTNAQGREPRTRGACRPTGNRPHRSPAVSPMRGLVCPPQTAPCHRATGGRPTSATIV
jgi:hypothetical protein